MTHRFGIVNWPARLQGFEGVGHGCVITQRVVAKCPAVERHALA